MSNVPCHAPAALQATENQPQSAWAVTDGSGRKALPVAGPSPTALDACGAAVYVIDKVRPSAALGDSEEPCCH